MKHNDDIQNDLRNEELAPLFFKFMIRAEMPERQSPVKMPFIEVDYYQTKRLIPYRHYKPISKIIFWEFT